MVRCHKHGKHSDVYKRKWPNKSGQREACRPCARERAATFKTLNPERWKIYRENQLAKDPEYYKRKQKKHRLVLKLRIFAEYGGRCVCCGETAPEFLSIDHVAGGGNEHRKTLSKSRSRHPGGLAFYQWLKRSGFPKDGYRLLCMNCNFAEGKMGGCPHRRKNPE